MPLDSALTRYPGQNFAPLKPLQEARQIGSRPNRNPSASNAFFRELYQGYTNENEQAWQEVIDQARVIAHLSANKLVMKRDLQGTGYVFLTPISSSRDRSNSAVFPHNVEIHKAKWQKVKPTIEAQLQGDGYKAEIQANLLNVAVQHDFTRIFTPKYEMNEALSAIEFGTYITQFEYDQKLNQIQRIVPIIQNESKVLMPGYGACYDCKYEGTPADFQKTGAPAPQCPECESFRTTDMVPEAVADESRIVDVQQIVQGDLCGYLRPLAACRFDSRCDVQDSGHFIYRERVPLRLIQQTLGEDLAIDTGETDDIGLQLIDSLSVRGGSTNSAGENDLWNTPDRFREEGTMFNMYLKPEEYAGFRLRSPEKTLSGTIPADVDWSELFPEGLCVRGFNEGNLITGYHPTPSNACSAPFMLQSHTGIGTGLAAAADLAKDMNELWSMVMSGAKRYGASGIAIAKETGITQGDARNLFKPNRATFVDTQNVGGDINKAIMQVTPQTVNPALPQLLIQMNNMIGLAFMTGDFSQGATNDVDINTLGGQELAHAKAEGQKAGIYAMKISHRCEAARILTDLRRRHIKFPKFYAGDRQGATKGRWISADDMPERAVFVAVPDSEIPQNVFEKRSAAREMVQEAGGLAPLLQIAAADPRNTGWFTKQFGIELPGLNEEEMQIICLARIANIKELSESGLYNDPEQVLMMLEKPLKVRETLHLLKAAFISEILDDDEVSEWHPLTTATVELLIERHGELEAEAQLMNQQIAMRAQARLAAEQAQMSQAMQQPMIDQQRAMQAEDQQNAMAQELAGRVLDDEQAQVDAEREQDAANDEFARQQIAADRDHQRSLELEREKARLAPKPTPAPAKKPSTAKGK